ncbi:MAG: cbb3-type cytochrome c oxidase subunit 3 [Deltaproteobacteria bacterium]|nr:cbb3-type cytochrome c oxidase subunit 3 [Deltaproteobacteria bacterium]
MRGLSDAVGAANLSSYAVIAMVLFIAAFGGIIAYLLLRRNRQVFDRARQMPLDDEQVQTPRNAENNGAAQ